MKIAQSVFAAVFAVVGLTALTAQSAAANFGNQLYTTNRDAVASVQQNGNQYRPVQKSTNRSVTLAPARFTLLSSQNGLPTVSTDSFVKNAGGNAEAIYGDEGTDSIPPYLGFSYQHRINAGISGQTDTGLTTGHGSMLPSAFGADEFLAPPGEKSMSGSNGGNPQLNNADAALNTADQTETQNLNTAANPAVTANLPPSPGPGYYPIIMCGGVFAGYMSPDLVALGQSDWGAALAAFARSGACDPTCALELLVETGNATPDEQAQMTSIALFGG